MPNVLRDTRPLEYSWLCSDFVGDLEEGDLVGDLDGDFLDDGRDEGFLFSFVSESDLFFCEDLLKKLGRTMDDDGAGKRQYLVRKLFLRA